MQQLKTNAVLSLSLKLALISFLLNVASDTSGVFQALYAQSLGASNFEIGLIASTFGIAFFLASITFGRLSDMYGRLVFIRAGLGLSAVAYLAQVFSNTTFILLAARGAIGFFLGIVSVVIMAYTYENQKQIGNFISYGSLGLVAAAIIAATVKEYKPLFLVSTGCSALAFLLSFTLREQPVSRLRVSILPVGIIKTNHKVYVSFFLRQFGANAIWAIFPLYLVGIGASKPWIALISGLNNGTQFILMRFMERFNPAKIFRLGLLISMAAFAIYGIANHYLLIIPTQLVLALSWCGMFLGAMGYLFKNNPERGTVSGLLYSTLSLSAGLGPFAGGAISNAWGFPAVMGFGSGMTLLGYFYSRGLKIDDKK